DCARRWRNCRRVSRSVPKGGWLLRDGDGRKVGCQGRTGSRDQVLEAVREASRGGSPLNSLIARKIVQYFHYQPTHPGIEQPISIREREVLELLSKGLPYKEIADMLGINIETVRKHCHNI